GPQEARRVGHAEDVPLVAADGLGGRLGSERLGERGVDAAVDDPERLAVAVVDQEARRGALGVQLGQLERECGVERHGSGTTAVQTSSTLAAGSKRPLTSRSAIAG